MGSSMSSCFENALFLQQLDGNISVPFLQACAATGCPASGAATRLSCHRPTRPTGRPRGRVRGALPWRLVRLRRRQAHRLAGRSRGSHSSSSTSSSSSRSSSYNHSRNNSSVRQQAQPPSGQMRAAAAVPAAPAQVNARRTRRSRLAWQQRTRWHRRGLLRRRLARGWTAGCPRSSLAP